MLNEERGSAPVESTFAIVMLLFLVLGTIQVALALYGRNVVAATAHEAARAGVERGASAADARTLALATIDSAGGRLVDGLTVSVDVTDDASVRTVRVRMTGRIEVLGPIPFPVPVEASATARAEGEVR